MNPLSELSLLIQSGENSEAVAFTGKLLADSYSTEDIINSISQGMVMLRNKCTIENFQLLDVLLACRAMVEVVDECVATTLEKEMDSQGDQYDSLHKGEKLSTIVIGTIEGDVHDLGKHIVATMCRFNDFKIINLGKDVSVDTFVNAAIAENADFLAVSSLMTVCMSKIREIGPALKAKNYRDIKIIGGGAAVLQSTPESLNLDYIAQDAFDGLNYFYSNSKSSV